MSEWDDLSEENSINDIILVLNYINEKFPLDNIIVIAHSMGVLLLLKLVKKFLKIKRNVKIYVIKFKD